MLQGNNGITVWKAPLRDPTIFRTEPIFVAGIRSRRSISKTSSRPWPRRPSLEKIIHVFKERLTRVGTRIVVVIQVGNLSDNEQCLLTVMSHVITLVTVTVKGSHNNNFLN